MSSWSTISTIINGDISYVLKQTNLTNDSVDFILTSYSLKWDEFDISIEYRNSSLDEWRDDIVLTFTTANMISNNQVYGLQASQYGTDNTIRWNFSNNNVSFGTSIQLLIRIVPRIRNFSRSVLGNIVTDLYGNHNSSWVGSSGTHRFMGMNKIGQYMCISGSSFYILDTITSTTPVYNYPGLLNPSHAIQTDSGNYIIADYGNNQVLEVDITLATTINTYAIASPVFVDYDNSSSSCLITSETLNIVREVSLDFGTTIWQSVVALSSPLCGTYALGYPDEVVICDTGNKRIVVLYRTLGTTTIYTGGRLSSAGIPEIPFYMPFRAYKTTTDKIYVVEKTGEIITFSTGPSVESSSSST